MQLCFASQLITDVMINNLLENIYLLSLYGFYSHYTAWNHAYFIIFSLERNTSKLEHMIASKHVLGNNHIKKEMSIYLTSQSGVYITEF
jgi:hypothetical protein